MNVSSFVRTLGLKEVRIAGGTVLASVMVATAGLAVSGWQPIASMSAEAPPVVPAAMVALKHPAARKPFSLLPKHMMAGMASWYGPVLNGHKTANGETFDMTQMTACHRTLPFGTMVRVVDTHSGRSVIVRINDRGVLFADRVIDLSVGAAERLGIKAAGVASVRLEVLSKQAAAELAAVVPRVGER